MNDIIYNFGRIKNELIVLLLISILFLNCSKPILNTGSLQLNYRLYFGDTILQKDNQYPFSTFGKKYFFRPDVVKIYLSNVRTSNNIYVLSYTDIALMNLNDSNTLSIFYNFKSNERTSPLEFTLGLTSEYNNSDPNKFPIEHPLSTAKSMYWGMMKYRFVVIEGSISDSNGVTLNNVSYHTGVDLSRFIVFKDALKLGVNHAAITDIKIDIKKIFTYPGQEINPVTEKLTHSSPGAEYELAKKITNNLESGISILKSE